VPKRKIGDWAGGSVLPVVSCIRTGAGVVSPVRGLLSIGTGAGISPVCISAAQSGCSCMLTCPAGLVVGWGY
jgi:hypothetical protein